MNRRAFITLLSGAAAAWPIASQAQQDGRVRRVGVLFGGSESAPELPAFMSALREELARLGWNEGRNLRIDLRFGAADPARYRNSASELLSLAAEVIIASGFASMRAAQQQTRAVPIVFMGAGDAVEGGLVANLARPEGNMTGFPNFYATIAGKWVELLKEAAPRVTRMAVVYNPQVANTNNYLASIEAAATAQGVRIIDTPIRNAVETVRAVDAFAAEPNGGFIVL